MKSAASYALGSIAVGNLPEYLPFVLQEITASKRQYLLLHSLKEIISSACVRGLKPYVELVWALLLKHSECQEEGTRNVVAECLGKLTLIDPETLLPRLKGYLQSGDPAPPVASGDAPIGRRSPAAVSVRRVVVRPQLRGDGGEVHHLRPATAHRPPAEELHR